ncbi:Ni/Fe hydrogenase [Alteribacter lacisalsi]|uniref:Ni/Fe hydrogenase n=1 Tax=Alteribacter lacisalsi TaxID=2045244 RepID=A0A2W0HJ09_9BACI|nr:nickel-dependent hydrogenase large subunit [Alteribacter lacisalsi]PYZ97485.1 Ni/Fe hydrogenase [Alteribacter lacisalsi]
MTKRIVVNPLTRISGFMEVDVKVENGQVVDAQTKGNMFRGFEQMLMGRSPFDAIYFTQRICGICSAAHSMASSLALEDALDIEPLEQGRYLRDIIHCCEFLQNHIRHFYQYTLPDFVKIEQNPLFQADHTDFRLPDAATARISRHYFESLTISRRCHEMLAILGGKAPHNHGVFVGGVTTKATAEVVAGLSSILAEVTAFLEEKMVPDVYEVARYYPEYYRLGGGYGNLMSYGVFDRYRDLGTLYVDPLVWTHAGKEPFDETKITENIDRAWYKGTKQTYVPDEEMTEPDRGKASTYSFVKAPRYDGQPMEVGPLARLILSGEYTNGVSAMDRTIARAIEAVKIAGIMKTLLGQLVPDTDVQAKYTIPETAQGRGLTDTTRGGLGHWLKIKDRKLSFYQIITPSTWDFSPADDRGFRGTAEEALMGTPVQNADEPVEIGRILRSFDPCMSCATHVSVSGKPVKTIKVFG